MNSMLESVWFISLYPVALILSIASGYLVARKQYVEKKISWKPSSTENAIIGFYGLLLSFSLYSSGNSYRERTSMVHQHVDAIASIQREGLLANDSVRITINSWVKEALLSELKYYNDDSGPAKTEKRTDSLYTGLISSLKQMSESQMINASQLRFLMDKINAAISLGYRIQYSHQERTPATVLTLLILGSLLIGLLIGFANGFNENLHLLVPLIFFLLTSLTISTILDMDNPSFGIIRPSHENYVNMLNTLEAINS